jgi:hypothetical protein
VPQGIRGFHKGSGRPSWRAKSALYAYALIQTIARGVHGVHSQSATGSFSVQELEAMLPLFEKRCGSDVGVSTTAPRAARRRIESGKSDIRRAGAGAGSDSLGGSVRRPGSCRRVRTSQRRMPRMSTSARTRIEQPRRIRSQTPGSARFTRGGARHMRRTCAIPAHRLRHSCVHAWVHWRT